MGSLRPQRLLILFFCFNLMLFSSPLAQHFLIMTDEQWVELAVDMIRKGVQQQDTTKILRALAPEISAKGQVSQSKADIVRTLQGIFDQSHKRKVELQKPEFPRADNPLHHSNFWDFDILDPKITIDGDSAVVECELVLWGSRSDEPAGRRGARTYERFVFRTPPPDRKTRPPGAEAWPSAPLGKKQEASLRTWKVESFDTLLDFLGGELSDLRKNDKRDQSK
jgi:hypothetical protein